MDRFKLLSSEQLLLMFEYPFQLFDVVIYREPMDAPLMLMLRYLFIYSKLIFIYKKYMNASLNKKK